MDSRVSVGRFVYPRPASGPVGTMIVGAPSGKRLRKVSINGPSGGGCIGLGGSSMVVKRSDEMVIASSESNDAGLPMGVGGQDMSKGARVSSPMVVKE
jgi:hypothetical protein